MLFWISSEHQLLQQCVVCVCEQDNRNLKEQNDELNGQIINLSIQGAKNLFSASFSESLAAEISSVSRDEVRALRSSHCTFLGASTWHGLGGVDVPWLAQPMLKIPLKAGKSREIPTQLSAELSGLTLPASPPCWGQGSCSLPIC